MAIIAVFGGAYCHTQQVAEAVAKRLGYTIVASDLTEKAAARFGIGVDNLSRAMTGPEPFLGRFTRQKETAVASLRLVLAEMIRDDNRIVLDYPALLVPREITHALRVCVIANPDYRVKTAMESEKLSERDAQKAVRKDDKSRLDWSQLLLNKAPYDPSLFDITLPMHDMTVDQAVEEICRHAASDAVRTTERSKAAAGDFVLAAQINLEAVKQGHEVDVLAENGTVYITLNKYVSNPEGQKETLRKLATESQGVTGVQFRLGPGYHVPTSNPWANIDVPPKILLVDDEKEFVHTLSDRLQTRNLESSVVYDGEQALKFVSEDQPDVMVLDLMMPGIDGIEVLRRMKRDHPAVEVIILTGHGSDREKEQAFELGAFAYLQKPVDIDVLTQTMKEAYERVGNARRSSGDTSENA